MPGVGCDNIKVRNTKFIIILKKIVMFFNNFCS